MTQWIISSSILILVMVLLRFLLRKRIKPAVQYALWALVLARLLIPVQFGNLDISVQNAVGKAPVIRQMELADQVEHFVYHADGTATGYYEFQPNFDHTDQPVVSKPIPEVFTIQQAETIKLIRSVKDVLTQVWLWGMVVVGLVFVLSNVRFSLGLRNRKKLEDSGILPVYVTENVETPCLFGLFRPAIYLPPAVAEDESHLRYSLAHETTHYRHGDAIWSVLRCVCIVVHWYNPLVWWVAVLSREDGEIACDEATIVHLGEGHRADYGRVLVDLTCRKRTDLLQTATTMTGSAKGLKKRIEMIVKRPKMALYTLIIVLLVVSIAAGCTFTGGNKPTETDPIIDPTTDSTTETTGETTETANSTETTQKEETGATLPKEIVGTSLTETELQDFNHLFAWGSERTNWYNIILACGQNLDIIDRQGFASPEAINTRSLFHNGFYGEHPEWRALSAAEEAFLNTCPGYIPQMDVVKLPVSEMEKVLNTYLGISLQDTNPAHLEKFWYFAETDCYYHNVSDFFSAESFQVVDGKWQEDGSVYLLAERDEKYFECVILLRLIPNSDNEEAPYRVYSCMELLPAN